MHKNYEILGEESKRPKVLNEKESHQFEFCNESYDFYESMDNQEKF